MTVDRLSTAVLRIVSVVIEGRGADAVDSTVIVGTGAVTVWMVGGSLPRSLRMAEIAGAWEAVVIDEARADVDEGVIIMAGAVTVTSRIAVDMIVSGGGPLDDTF